MNMGVGRFDSIEVGDLRKRQGQFGVAGSDDDPAAPRKTRNPVTR